MTTPASNTPHGIICDAMLDAGLLPAGQEPNSEQYATYSRRLRQMIKAWNTQGLKLFLQVDTPVPLVATQATYSFSPGGSVSMTKPLRVLQGYYLDVNGVKRPLTILSRDEYMRLSQVTQLGAVNSYFVDKQNAQIVVSLWLVPDTTAAAGTVHLLLEVAWSEFASLTQDIGFPPEWELALHWGLSAEICTGQPQAVIDRCEGKAQTYRTMLEDWDVEDAETRMTPDPRMIPAGSFH